MAAADEPLDELEELLIEILAAIDDNEDPEALLARHPEHAAGLRRRLTHLGTLNLDGSLVQNAPDRIGPYRLIERLGQGGMGEVWRAAPLAGGTEVALKFVRVTALAASYAARFSREASALERLEHAGIVGLHGSGEADGFRFIAMELLEGRSLAQLLKDEGTPDASTVVCWGRDLARALAAAHAAGVVHRDVKPSNVQITPDGRAVLIDFGLTRGVGPSSLSITGRFVGSPHYAAPEQIRGAHDEVGPAADIYSLGVTLYEALCGSSPFEGGSAEQLFHRILTHEPLPLRRRRPQLPASLEAVITCALEKRPADRYSSATELALDLEAVMKLRPVSVRGPGPLRRLRGWVRRRPALAMAVALLALALVGSIATTLLGRRADRLARKQLALDNLAEAQAEFDQYLDLEEDLPDKLEYMEWFRPHLATVAYDPEETRALDELQREIERTETMRERIFTDVMETLRSAEGLDPTLAEIDLLRARLYVQRWRHSRNSGDPVMADFYAARVRELDAVGDIAAEVDPTTRVTITTTPPGARVDAFVFLRQDLLVEGGEPRLVPVPIGGLPAGAHPGRRALKVRAASAPLRPEDLILEVAGVPVEGTVFVQRNGALPEVLASVGGVAATDVGAVEDAWAAGGDDPPVLTVLSDSTEVELPPTKDVSFLSPLELAREGGVSARVWRDGETFEVTLPALEPVTEPDSARNAFELRPTAAPLYHGAGSLVGTTPLDEVAIEGDGVMFLVRAEGYEPFRYFAGLTETQLHFELDPIERFPAAFVRYRSGVNELIVMDREVTVAEYAEFLVADPAQSPPRGWTRGADGSLEYADGLRPDFPVAGVSWRDTQDYARWRTTVAREAGQPDVYKLPSASVWQSIVRTEISSRPYVWGGHHRSHYAKSCFSRATPRPEPTLRFPIDETVLGIHDTAGGVAEFCDDWFWKERGERPIAGGSWIHAEPIRFEARFLWGSNEERVFEFVGFRLAIEASSE